MHEVFFCRWTGGPASRMQRSRVYRGSSAAQIAIKGMYSANGSQDADVVVGRWRR